MVNKFLDLIAIHEASCWTYAQVDLCVNFRKNTDTDFVKCAKNNLVTKKGTTKQQDSNFINCVKGIRESTFGATEVVNCLNSK